VGEKPTFPLDLILSLQYHGSSLKTKQEIRESFMVIEGLDGAGTTTQLSLFDKKLEKESIPHFCTFEPTKGPVGMLIRSILRTENKVDAGTTAFLFSADRNEHLYHPDSGITGRLDNGELVISDRYLFSSLAYQSVMCDFDFVLSLNKSFPLPSHLFFLDVPIAICMKRLSERSTKEMYETSDFQEKVLEGYERTLSFYRYSGMTIHRIDGTLQPETVFQKIWDVVASLPILKK
jgi:dTMP kinase